MKIRHHAHQIYRTVRRHVHKPNHTPIAISLAVFNIILLCAIAGLLVYQRALIRKQSDIRSVYSRVNPRTVTYVCPSNGWVDCMPGPVERPECSPDAMAWYKEHCPDFKGGAL